MDRLTFDGNFCDIAMCRETKCPYDGACTQRQVWERLKAYEETGLEPEEVAEMVSPETVEIARLLEKVCKEGSAQHMLELFQAEKDGRLVVLPRGTDVELVRDGHTFKADHWNHTLTAFRDEPETKSGKQVALFSIEEAEAALAGKGGAK